MKKVHWRSEKKIAIKKPSHITNTDRVNYCHGNVASEYIVASRKSFTFLRRFPFSSSNAEIVSTLFRYSFLVERFTFEIRMARRKCRDRTLCCSMQWLTNPPGNVAAWKLRATAHDISLTLRIFFWKSILLTFTFIEIHSVNFSHLQTLLQKAVSLL